MKLTRNMKNYEPLVIPLDKPIEDLTKKEAKMYFDWFILHIDERTEYLIKKIVEELEISAECLDFSFESLKLVWEWFLNVAEISKKPWQIIKEMKVGLQGQSFITHVLDDRGKELSIFTQYVLRDIGMYIGKVFITNSSSIRWTFKTSPKSYVSVNEPILVGFVDDNPDYPKPFYPDLNPIALAEVCALNILDKNQKKSDLYDRCMKWKQWAPMKE